MQNNPVIVTDRLLLRGLKLSDSPIFFNYRSDATANKFQGWIPETLDDAVDFIQHKISTEINIAGTWFQFAILEKQSNACIGDIGIRFADDNNYEAEIGYTLNKKMQGFGFATEAVKAIIDYLCIELNKTRIVASLDPRNLKSIQLLERLGFKQESFLERCYLLHGEWVDDVVYVFARN